jgi:hypothetical protein
VIAKALGVRPPRPGGGKAPLASSAILGAVLMDARQATPAACVGCGAEFIPAHGPWIYCDTCAEGRRKTRASAGCLDRRRSELEGRRQISSLPGESPRTAHRLYPTWKAMIRRCTNPRDIGWRYCGGRGIAVCERWRSSFEAFCADMGQRPPGRTLDRIDPRGPYAPENCRWATPRDQYWNRLCPAEAPTYEAFGRQQKIKQWGAEFGIHPATLLSRLERGITLEEALTRPVERRFTPRRWRKQ